MKKLITSILFLYCSSVIVSQTATDDYYSSKPKIDSADKVSTSITMGAGLSFLNSSKSSLYTSFIAPKIGYQITPKFKLNLGFMHYSASGNTFMQLNPNESILNASNNTVSGNLIFVGGDYQLNPRLIMSGAVMMDVNNQSSKQNNFKAATVGLEYKVSEHSSIGFKASVSQGSGDYYLNSRTGKYDYNPASVNSAESLFLLPLTQWGMEKNLTPTIR